MTNFFSSLVASLEADLDVIEADAKNLFQSEVTALTPIAETAVANLVTDEVADLTTPGGTKNTGKTLATVVSATVSAAETAGIQTGAASILTAVGNALPAPTSAAS